MNNEGEEEGTEQQFREKDFISYAWNRKWLVIFFFVLPVILSIIITLLMPTSYDTEAIFQIKKLPEVDEERIDFIKQEELRVLVDSNELLSSSVENLEPEIRNEFEWKNDRELVHWIKDNLETEAASSKGTIRVILDGATRPEVLAAVLEEVLGRLKITASSLFEERVTKRREVLQVKLDILENELDSLVKSADDLKGIGREEPNLKAGEQDGSLRGLILKGEFKSINDQISELRRERNEVEIKNQSLKKVAPADFQPLRILSEPYIPEVPTGPKWKLNLALGVLAGLFLMVFGISFIRYVAIKN